MTIGQSTSDDNWSEHNQKENIKTKMQKSKKVYYKNLIYTSGHPKQIQYMLFIILQRFNPLVKV